MQRCTLSLATFVLLAALTSRSFAQPAVVDQRGSGSDTPLIVTVRTNGADRGELSLVQKPDGDYWVLAADLPKLKVQASDSARRHSDNETFYSLSALGARDFALDEKDLSLSLTFPADRIESNEINLASRPPPLQVSEPQRSLILSYRLAARSVSQGSASPVTANTDLNVRLGRVLLRQENRLDLGSGRTRLIRGPTQALWDNSAAGARLIIGDVISTAGSFGSAVTGAGVLYSRLFELTPDVIRQPTANFRTSSALPAEVQVDVDGSPIYRASVGPGPINLNNLLLYGGSRNVRVTVTDAAGRREVIDRQFVFTDDVLAEGLHEYSYFIGKRSVLGIDNRIGYREPAWQAFHRFGATESMTVAAGGEGSTEFGTFGAGLALRNAMLGVASLQALASRGRSADGWVPGYSARYSYLLPRTTFTAGRRVFGDGFRTFTTTDATPFLRSENRVGVTTSLWLTTVSAEIFRSRDALGDRLSRVVRVFGSLSRGLTASLELESRRDSGRPEWSASMYLRYEFGGGHWVGSNTRASANSRTIDVETGKLLDQGEGIGYRVGSTTTFGAATQATSAFASANWNLRPVSLDFLGSAPVNGGGSQYAEVGVSGALVGIDGFWGLTRRVDDSFVLARLGVAQSGVNVLLNNQVQGSTDKNGNVFIPRVTAFGRQDVSVEEKQIGMQFNLTDRRRTVVPSYRSGMVVDFGGNKVRAVAGVAWQVAGDARVPIPLASWTMTSGKASLSVETANSGEFYFEDAAPGTYTGGVKLGGKAYQCRMLIPEFSDAVIELAEGIVCE